MFARPNYSRSLCGCWYAAPVSGYWKVEKKYLPQVQLSSSTNILATTSRTTLRQTFVNNESRSLEQVQYTFPLYDGVSVVGFTCTVGSKTIVGIVKERQQARVDYQAAVSRGETAGLLEQLPEASDVFTTSIGNIPPNEKIMVEIVYLGELKHDAETDGSRFTIPTVIAPRYGPVSTDSAQVLSSTSLAAKTGISISVDVTLEEGSIVRGLQSPSHPIAVTMGRTSTMDEDSFNNNHASATLTLGSTELEKDFVIVVLAKGTDTPRALLETHPTIPNQRALMATLVPKFNIPSISPEIVFVVDRSGSMGGKIELVVAAMKIFLKSLPVGVKFNICSFGSHHSFLFKKSKTYDQSSLKDALKHLESFSANYGGTEMLQPVKETVKNRYNDLPLEAMILTDGEIWNQDELFKFINTTSNARFFTLGIGSGASSALVEGIARAGNGFAQFVGENEKMDKRVVRMLKGALTPHVTDYKLEVTYNPEEVAPADDDFEMIDSEKPARQATVVADLQESGGKKPISLFDTNATEQPTNPPAGRYDSVPDVPSPKILQAPDQIPALFPFNRTTVYLLLSPESTRQVPKSVILRGTSEHGPLEQEILVQDVGTGETIHQLAAKKAIHELEQGRGWITKARNAENTLLKSTHEGKWDLIVEREAVRLGVQFQVGGKWCSFVAVEKQPGDKSANPPEYSEKELNTDGGSNHMRKSSPFNRLFGAPVTMDACDVSRGPFINGPNGSFGVGSQPGYQQSGPGQSSGGEPATNTTSGSLFGATSAIHSGPAPSLYSGNTTPESGGLVARIPTNALASAGGLFGTKVVDLASSSGGLFGQSSFGFGSRGDVIPKRENSAPFGAPPAGVASQQTRRSLFGGLPQASSTPSLFSMQEQTNDTSNGPDLSVTCNLKPPSSGQLNSTNQGIHHIDLPFHLPCYALANHASTQHCEGTRNIINTDDRPDQVSLDDKIYEAYTAEMNDAACMPLPDESDSDLDLATDILRNAPLAKETPADQRVNTEPQDQVRKRSAPTSLSYRGGYGAPLLASSAARSSAPAPAPVLQQYQMGLMKLEQQNKNRLPMYDVQAANAQSIHYAMPPGGAAPPPAPPRSALLSTGSAALSLSSGPEPKAKQGAKGFSVAGLFGSSGSSEAKAGKSTGGSSFGGAFFRNSAVGGPTAFSSRHSSSREAEKDVGDGEENQRLSLDRADQYVDYSEESYSPQDVRAATSSPSDKMHALIGLQSFDGAWSASKQLFQLLGIDSNKISTLSKDESVSVTALAIAWLKKHACNEEDVWEMVVDKALGWLEAKVGRDEAAKVLADAGNVV
ncbi:uncharacterized protein A1O9_08838 [Exophiala aquamarina CBS 119918]|uniref:Uncharacterized protein n=1 Tax=Exophiala aquamarina CBS 119918 TaxID=1182545 RepID=A0A072P4Z2_9EURO|nr:uncharacterized protein A1O9_08838 [Exophiala aquamarina CBS 119918]KEF55184.1 hypothetical protein A1O9_08838 [Exophiala aquamarina CBS 119918]